MLYALPNLQSEIYNPQVDLYLPGLRQGLK